MTGAGFLPGPCHFIQLLLRLSMRGAMADKTVRGRFVWHELMTPDPKAAAAFYKDIVGWTPQPYDKDPSYTLFTSGGRPMAGSTFLPEQAKAMGAPPHLL